MKRACILAAITFLACTTGGRDRASWFSQWLECEHRGVACNERIEAKAITARSSLVSRVGDALHLDVGTGSDVIFMDNRWEGSETRVYRYLGEFEPFPYLVVHLGYYEGDEFLLINRHDGSVLRVPAVPVTSPDGRRIAVASGMLADYNPNRIEVWRLAGTHLEREWMFEPKGWAARIPEWVSESEFRACKLYFTLAENADPTCQCEPIVVKLASNEWRARDESSCSSTSR